MKLVVHARSVATVVALSVIGVCAYLLMQSFHRSRQQQEEYAESSGNIAGGVAFEDEEYDFVENPGVDGKEADAVTGEERVSAQRGTGTNMWGSDDIRPLPVGVETPSALRSSTGLPEVEQGEQDPSLDPVYQPERIQSEYLVRGVEQPVLPEVYANRVPAEKPVIAPGDETEFRPWTRLHTPGEDVPIGHEVLQDAGEGTQNPDEELDKTRELGYQLEVVIITEPIEGVDIYLNNFPQGTSPLVMPLEIIPPARFVVRAEKEGFATTTQIMLADKEWAESGNKTLILQMKADVERSFE